MSNRQTHVVVGMSGGVDSSVAALLLQQQGYRVTGLFMKNWEEDDDAEYCSAAEDLADAQAVCDRLSIELRSVNFATEYWDNVFEHFLREYEAGRTPNPDVMCNREIKFRAFLDFAMDLGADKIATGHYAATHNTQRGVQLLRANDPNKDQSYFLHTLDQFQLRHALFPLAQLDKARVRALARDAGFETSEKKDSTGICFIGERRFDDFLNRFLSAEPGPIVSLDGERLGTHKGLIFYTIGQRQGLRIGGVSGADEAAWFVSDKHLPSNELIVVQGHDHPALLKPRLRVSQLSWISEIDPDYPLRCTSKIRYRQPDQACWLEPPVDGQAIVRFDHPQRAVTPGQSVVFYQNDVCLGGGIIEAGIGPCHQHEIKAKITAA